MSGFHKKYWLAHRERCGLLALLTPLFVHLSITSYAGEVVASSAGAWFAVDARTVKDTTWEGGVIVGGETNLLLQSSPNAWGEAGGATSATITWVSTSGNSGTVSEATTEETVSWTPEAQIGTNELTYVSGSVVKTARFKVVCLQPEKPVVSPVDRTTFDTSLTVSMTCASLGATIHFTTNGMTPTIESATYKKFRIYGKTTVKAIAFYVDGTPSEMAVVEYAKGQCADPVISLVDGSVFKHSNQEVSISGGADGTLRYTLDGSEPTAESPIYTGPFTINETTTVKAKVFSGLFFDSQVVTSTLTREWETVETPVITAASSFMGSRTQVSISCATPGALIRYTTNGNDPNSHSTKYTGPFDVIATCTVKAYAVLADYENSAIATRAIEKIWGVGDSVGAPDQPFTTSGNLGWVRDKAVFKDGSESIRSGAITHNQSSVLSTTVNGKGTVSFWWKTSCEEDESHEWDHAECSADGTLIAILDGITEWKQVTHTFTTDGDHTVTWKYVKDDVESAGEDCVWMDAFEWTPSIAPSRPSVDDDPGATVTGDASAGYVVKPSEGKTSVEVTIPTGVEPSKVTVEVSSSVKTIRPNGASVKVVNGTSDITSYLDIPTAVDGVVNLGVAEVKAAIVKEAMDPAAGAQIEINAENPSLTTSATKPGLVYTLREGASLESMASGDSKVGDGQPWTPNVTVKGGTSGFYSISVGK